MLSNTSTGLKLHLMLIIIIAGVAYFMYQLYSECKDLERELMIAKKQIALLTTKKEGDCLATLLCPLKCGSGTCAKANDDHDDHDDEEEEEIDIDDDISVKSEYINKVMANVQQAHIEESDAKSDKSSKEDDDEEEEQEEEEEEEEEEELDTTPSLSKLPKAELIKLKLTDLKEFLKGCKQSTTGSKSELVSRILSLA